MWVDELFLAFLFALTSPSHLNKSYNCNPVVRVESPFKTPILGYLLMMKYRNKIRTQNPKEQPAFNSAAYYFTRTFSLASLSFTINHDEQNPYTGE